MNEIKMTEDELSIELIDRGENGKERSTKDWIDKGYLEIGRNTYKSFIAKVEQYYTVIEKSGRGTKRVYTLLEKERIEIRKMNHKGDVATIEETQIKEYVFNKLVESLKLKENKNGYFSTKTWLLKLNLILHFDEKFNRKLHTVIYNTYREHTNQSDLKEKAILTDYHMNDSYIKRQIFLTVLKKLQKENRIKFKERRRKDNLKFISDDELIEINATIDKKLAELEVSRKKYNMLVAGTISDANTLKSIESTLENEYGFSYHYAVFSIEIIDDEEKLIVNDSNFNKLVTAKLLKYTQSRQNKAIDSTIGIRKRFPYLHTLLILSYSDESYAEQFELELNAVKNNMNLLSKHL